MPCDCAESSLFLQPKQISLQKLETEVKLVSINWCPAIASGVTIESSDWVILQGTVTLDAEDLTDEIASVTIAGGAPGELALTLNTIVTDSGLTLSQLVECLVTPSYEQVEPAC